MADTTDELTKIIRELPDDFLDGPREGGTNSVVESEGLRSCLWDEQPGGSIRTTIHKRIFKEGFSKPWQFKVREISGDGTGRSPLLTRLSRQNTILH